MSDYFDNLIARSVGRAQVVQPRPASLFEPLQPIGLPGSLAVADHFAIEPEVDQSAPGFSPEPLKYEAAPSATDPGFLESQPSDRNESESSVPSKRLYPTIDLDASQSSSLLIHPEPLMPAPATESQSTSAYQPEQRSPSPSSRQVVDTHSTATRRTPLRAVLRAPTLTNNQSNSAEDAASLVPAQAEASEIVAPQIEYVERESSHSLLVAPSMPPKPVSRHQREDRATGHAAPSLIEAGAQVEQAPAIRITIGRVDVRAVMPDRPATRPAPERRSPALSLEEYLKQRSGGKP